MTVAIVDGRIGSAVRENLFAEGFCIFELPRCARLPDAVASHPDMLMIRLGDELIVEGGFYEENRELFDCLSEILSSINIKPTHSRVEDKYPHDCILNALRIDKRLFVKSDSVSREVLAAADRIGLKTVSVRQGYPACTVLALGSTHAITADRGMAKALSREGIEVLLIENGDVSLPPHEYGFIGGAAGVFGNKVYFLGDLKTHRHGDKIRRFCEGAGITLSEFFDREYFNEPEED